MDGSQKRNGLRCAQHMLWHFCHPKKLVDPERLMHILKSNVLESTNRSGFKSIQKGSSCLLHNTLAQAFNSRPKLAISSLALADLVGNKHTLTNAFTETVLFLAT